MLILLCNLSLLETIIMGVQLQSPMSPSRELGDLGVVFGTTNTVIHSTNILLYASITRHRMYSRELNQVFVFTELRW